MKRFFVVTVALIGLWCVQAQEPKPAEKPKPAPKKSVSAATVALGKPAGLEMPIGGESVAELLQFLGKKHGVSIRLDPVFFSKHKGYANVYETKITMPVIDMTLRDVLTEILEQIRADEKAGITVKAGQIILGESFEIPSSPGGHKRGDVQLLVPEDRIARMLSGPTVDVSADSKTLAEIVDLLRESSGANIAVDPQIKTQAAKKISISFSDARLMTVLKVAGDMCDVAPAVIDNVFYLTTRENAAKFNDETEKNVFGK